MSSRSWGLSANGVAGLMDAPCPAPGTPPTGNYGGTAVTFDPDNPPPPSEKPPVTVPTAGNYRCKVAIAWQPTTSCTQNDCVEGQGFDFDVCLFDAASRNQITCAQSWDDNHEVIDVPCTLSEQGAYIVIVPFSGTAHATAEVAHALFIIPDSN